MTTEASGTRYIDAKGYARRYLPGHPGTSSDGYVYEHRLIAEQALGKPLPDGADVHHHNGVKSDNGRGNLVLCEDRAYHMLLHRRQKALKECGHADWVKCEICGEYDDPEDMWVSPKHSWRAYHRPCNAEAQRRRRARKSA